MMNFAESGSALVVLILKGCVFADHGNTSKDTRKLRIHRPTWRPGQSPDRGRFRFCGAWDPQWRSPSCSALEKGLRSNIEPDDRLRYLQL